MKLMRNWIVMGMGSGVGDLIELTDAFAIGEGDEDEGRGEGVLMPEAQTDLVIGIPGMEGMRERGRGTRDGKGD